MMEYFSKNRNSDMNHTPTLGENEGFLFEKNKDNSRINGEGNVKNESPKIEK
jgi:hypothetical protein